MHRGKESRQYGVSAGGSGDPEDIPDVPEVPLSREGDVWVCGPHRIACGDCADVRVIDALMQGELADLCVTDPPYNVAYESKLAGNIKNDDMGDAEFRKMPVFNFDVPVALPGVDSRVLNPRDAWADKDAYDEGLRRLGQMFVDNFKKYTGTPSGRAVEAFGPQV